MTNGLIYDYTGRMILCGILAFIGWAIPSVWTVLMGMRDPFAHRTYTDARTGVTRYSMSRYWFRVARFTVGLPVAAMVLLTTTHLSFMALDWVAANWWVPIVLVVGAVLVAAFWWLIRRDAATERQDRAQLAALPTSVPAPAVAAQPLWSAPAVEGNWSDRA